MFLFKLATRWVNLNPEPCTTTILPKAPAGHCYVTFGISRAAGDPGVAGSTTGPSFVPWLPCMVLGGAGEYSVR